MFAQLQQKSPLKLLILINSKNWNESLQKKIILK